MQFLLQLGYSNKEIYEEQLYINILPNQDLFSFFNFTIQSDFNSENKDSLNYSPWLLRHLLFEQNIEYFSTFANTRLLALKFMGLTAIKCRSSNWHIFYSLKYGPHNQSIESRYSTLIHQLNGIFCTSFLNINPSLTAAPKLWLNDPTTKNKNNNNTDSNWRIGILSSESLCSENLKPWKKFLPCKQRGLVSLLEPKIC